MLDPGIIRNRAKIESTVANARRCSVKVVQRELGSLDDVPVVVRRRHHHREPASRHVDPGLPARPTISKAMSKDMKQRGFRFVGPTTMYALMQSVGMVNDHMTSCFRWKQLGGR